MPTVHQADPIVGIRLNPRYIARECSECNATVLVARVLLELLRQSGTERHVLCVQCDETPRHPVTRRSVNAAITDSREAGNHLSTPQNDSIPS